MPQFSPDFDVISKKKSSLMFYKLICQCHFHGPPKLHGPRGPFPPSRWPCVNATSAEAQGEPIFRIACF